MLMHKGEKKRGGDETARVATRILAVFKCASLVEQWSNAEFKDDLFHSNLKLHFFFIWGLIVFL